MQSNPRTTYPTQIPQSDDSDPNLHTQLVVRLLSGFGFHTPKQLYLKFSRVRVLSDCCRVSHLRLVPRILLMAVFSGGEHLWCPNISFILFHSLFCLLIDCFLHFLASFLHPLSCFLPSFTSFLPSSSFKSVLDPPRDSGRVLCFAMNRNTPFPIKSLPSPQSKVDDSLLGRALCVSLETSSPSPSPSSSLPWKANYLKHWSAYSG